MDHIQTKFLLGRITAGVPQPQPNQLEQNNQISANVCGPPGFGMNTDKEKLK
jgi:hypothetical protein